MFLCDKREKRRLLNECLIDLTLPHPKDDDLSWTVKDVNTGKWITSTKPPYVTDVDQTTKNIVQLHDVRRCDVCGETMYSGYCVHDDEYYCSDKCLYSRYTESEYMDLYLDDDVHYADWGETANV